MNSDFVRRGRVFDESIRLMKTLWKEDKIDFEGTFFHVKDALFLPKPVSGQIPVWIGGNGRTAVNRAARLGDGWHPVGPTAEAFKEGVEKIRRSDREVTISVRMTTGVRKKREDAALPGGEKRRILSGGPSEMRKTLSQLEEAGLDYSCASTMYPAAADIEADLKKFGAEVVRSYA
jgi:alkanesulfonate monooxygenase SsuD/methylene tetrahydromethanopterin reductase-like flavin-dependent oxidoreductase (luciferase family)